MALSVFFLVYKVIQIFSRFSSLSHPVIFLKKTSLSFILQGLQLCRKRRPTPPRPQFSPLDFALCLFGLAWWIAVAITATIYGERANNAGLGDEDARTSVWSLAWANVFLFSVLSAEQVMYYYSSRQKIRYPAPPRQTTGLGATATATPLPQFSMAAPPAGPIPESPFVVPGYPAAPSVYSSTVPNSSIQMYGGYPLATEPPPSSPYSR